MSVRNHSLQTRARMVLEYLECAVREQLPDSEDTESDYAILADALRLFSRDIGQLLAEAPALYTPSFRGALLAADSWRVVTICASEKDQRRQRPCRCDGCGREEKWCGKALDLGGGNFKPQDWLAGAKALPHTWEAYADAYIERLRVPHTHGNLKDCDMGRFYLGATCLRKAKLTFLTSTLIFELMWGAWEYVRDLSDEDMSHGEMLTSTNEAADDLVEMKHELERCIADNRRASVPEVVMDRGYWVGIDAARSSAQWPASALQARASQTLRKHASLPSSSDSRFDERSDGNESDSGFDECDDTEEERAAYEEDGEPSYRRGLCTRDGGGGGSRPVVATRPHAKSRRRVVVDDDDEEEEGLAATDSHTQAVCDAEIARVACILTGTTAPEAVAVAMPAERRRSRRLAKVAPEASTSTTTMAATSILRKRTRTPSPSPTMEDESGVPELGATEPRAQEEEARPVAPLASRVRPRMPPAAAIATAMRIPPADGTQALLGSRRSVLLDTSRWHTELLAKGDDEDAARLNRIMITLHECIEGLERARGTRDAN